MLPCNGPNFSATPSTTIGLPIVVYCAEKDKREVPHTVLGLQVGEALVLHTRSSGPTKSKTTAVKPYIDDNRGKHAHGGLAEVDTFVPTTTVLLAHSTY